MKLLLFLLLTITLFSCKPFRDVQGIADSRIKITGTYLNDCDSIDDSKSGKMEYYLKLWKIIDRKYESKEQGLLVRISETPNGKLLAQLINQDTVISEKIIKGHFRNDQGYYRRNYFYIVPLNPFLWWFENKQTRYYSNIDYLIAEIKEDSGGVFLLMAGGHNNCAGRYYKKVEK